MVLPWSVSSTRHYVIRLWWLRHTAINIIHESKCTEWPLLLCAMISHSNFSQFNKAEITLLQPASYYYMAGWVCFVLLLRRCQELMEHYSTWPVKSVWKHNSAMCWTLRWITMGCNTKRQQFGVIGRSVNKRDKSDHSGEGESERERWWRGEDMCIYVSIYIHSP